MAKPNFTLPNKPAIKSGSILSYNYTDDFTFVPAPLTFNRDSAATRVNEKGLIEDVGYFGPELVQNGDFSEIGSDLVINGNFATNSDWNLGAGQWTISNGFAVADNASNNLHTSSPVATAAGLQYKVTFTLQDVSQGYVKVGLSSLNSTQFNSDGTYTLYIESDGNRFLYFKPYGFTGKLTNVSVKEVGQNWTFGAGWSVDQANSKAVYSDGAKFSQLKQQLINNSTSTYQLSFDTVVNAGQFRIKFGSNNYNIVSQSGSYKVNGVFSTTNTFITFEDYDDISSDFSISNVSVIEVLGDKPRIDYSDSLTEPSLLLEPQSTNLISYSENFSSWTKTGNTTISATNITSPSGKNNATNITGLNGTGGNDLRFYPSGFNSANKTLCFSVYLKGSGTLRLQMSNGIDDGGEEVITLTNNWKRHKVSKTFNSTSSSGFHCNIDDSSSSTATSYDVWGAQLEEKSYSTSYIPTAGSTATRLGETANNAGDVNVFNSEEGVFYAEFATISKNYNFPTMQVSDGTNNNAVRIFPVGIGTNNIQVQVDSGGSTSFVSTSTSNDPTQYNKIAVKYQKDNFSFYINGTQHATDNSGNAPVGLNVFSFLNNFFGKVKDVKVFNKALTDRELEILTIQ